MNTMARTLAVALILAGGWAAWIPDGMAAATVIDGAGPAGHVRLSPTNPNDPLFPPDQWPRCSA